MEIRLTHSPLSLEQAYESVHAKSFGAVALFVGNVRNTEGDQSIAAIEYEAYESMARRELEKAAQDAEKRFKAGVVIYHRLGKVPVGQTSLLVAVGAPHRAEAFAACQEVIERIKSQVPIWKTSFLPVLS